MRTFSEQTLAENNGKEGKPVYVCYQGRVIDVTGSKLWKTGQHMNRHPSGKDLTADFSAAPHGPEVLERYPQIGVLQKEAPPRPMPAYLTALLGRFPFLRRHIHPMLVHFPIVFFFAPALFNVLYLATGVPAFELTALHCLGAGFLFAFPAVGTGYFTWWLNYEARPMRPVRIKIRFSILLLIASAAALVWRLRVPEILSTLNWPGVLYFLLVLSLLPIVSVIGWFGATLTFPLERTPTK